MSIALLVIGIFFVILIIIGLPIGCFLFYMWITKNNIKNPCPFCGFEMSEYNDFGDFYCENCKTISNPYMKSLVIR